MTRVYGTFLINRAIVVEPTSLIASPFFCTDFFHFLQSSTPFSLLFQSSHFNYFSPRCELCMTAFAQACHWGIWGEMICINDGWWWRRMTKGQKMIWDRMRGGAVGRNVVDEPQIMAQMKLGQPFTFQPIISCLSVHKDDFCILETDPQSCTVTS